ncbi:hypothetical protein G6F46_007180 [Rhizopus delemar]|uniref:BTB domain-containing protein n=3 Tax=Rhizopus TaxID=4842 RepID=I1BPF4_RHIO9|nr:hypothetical protein RO3G_02788 [Rhizopus delemar RA 99-880]KAG1450985.1 hypothetical protein G6F55_009415 [Rhizopus delemar]KAG1542370.1 hypothetical protein G6F51_007316 [Rhizopus arrhizus]KAG1503559.1 hypothetical protein G6F54_001598 [Rhizopus delemar]KAG1568832.1 hypothetical protein G6F50_006937 [Rhizopus delemar]|eukprot:EIE78084.1 hypothetical protein RO3G_02788 [Rhizopus delemar RA 99-880]
MGVNQSHQLSSKLTHHASDPQRKHERNKSVNDIETLCISQKVADDVKRTHSSQSNDQIETVHMNNACEGYQPYAASELNKKELTKSHIHTSNESCKQIEETRKEDTLQPFDDENGSAKNKEQQLIENLWFEDIDNSGNSLIRLNVGGMSYCTQKSTLETSSFFEALIKTKEKIIVNSKGKQEIFINRNGKMFEYVFQYFITGKTDFLPNDLSILSCLKEEARFYQLESLRRTINQRILIESTRDSDDSCHKNKQTADTISKKFELLTFLNTQDPYWVCSRDILKHSTPNHCGKACKKFFNPDYHGWQFKDETKVVIATIEE